MAKLVLAIVVGLAGIVGNVWSQEVVVSGFPLGVGGSVEPDFFEPYFAELRAIADTLRSDPTASRDCYRQRGRDRIQRRSRRQESRPALGRAHVLRNLLVLDLGVDSARITIETQEIPAVGEMYRFASVRLVREAVPDYDARLDALENRPPVEKHFTEVKEVPAPFIENLGLQAAPDSALRLTARCRSWPGQ